MPTESVCQSNINNSLFSLTHCFSTGSDFAPRQGTCLQYLETFCIFITGDGEITTGFYWVDSRDAAQFPTSHRTVFQNNNKNPFSNVNSAEVKKPCKYRTPCLVIHHLPSVWLQPLPCSSSLPASLESWNPSVERDHPSLVSTRSRLWNKVRVKIGEWRSESGSRRYIIKNAESAVWWATRARSQGRTCLRIIPPRGKVARVFIYQPTAIISWELL